MEAGFTLGELRKALREASFPRAVRPCPYCGAFEDSPQHFLGEGCSVGRLKFNAEDRTVVHGIAENRASDVERRFARFVVRDDKSPKAAPPTTVQRPGKVKHIDV